MKDGKFSSAEIIKEAEKSGNIAKVKNAEIVGKECQSVGGNDRYVLDFSSYFSIQQTIFCF